MTLSGLRTSLQATLIAALFSPVGLSWVADKTAAATHAFVQNQRLGRGVNILGYDPVWRAREQARFQDKHFRQLRVAGFDSVRINLHPFRHVLTLKILDPGNLNLDVIEFLAAPPE